MGIKREILSNENRQTDIRLRIQIGATGAITAFNEGLIHMVSTVVRTSAGKITVTLDRPWARLLGVSHGIEFPGATTPTDGLISVDGTNVSVTGVAIIWTALAAAPTTAADVASGTYIDVTFHVSDSSV